MVGIHVSVLVLVPTILAQRQLEDLPEVRPLTTNLIRDSDSKVRFSRQGWAFRSTVCA